MGRFGQHSRMRPMLLAALPVAVLALNSCSDFHPDPTDDSNFSWITIKSDISQTVDVLECADGTGCHRDATLDAGGTADLRVQWGGMSEFQIRRENVSIGWLMIISKQREKGSIYYVGDASTDRKQIALDHGHPVPVK